jgi:hypothetical protein
MKGHFTPRKKKIHGPSISGAMKTVRVDDRTQIMVPTTISDEDAIERYLTRINASKQSVSGFKLAHKTKETEDDDIPQEELASVVDDSVLPEEE